MTGRRARAAFGSWPKLVARLLVLAGLMGAVEARGRRGGFLRALSWVDGIQLSSCGNQAGS